MLRFAKNNHEILKKFVTLFFDESGGPERGKGDRKHQNRTFSPIFSASKSLRFDFRSGVDTFLPQDPFRRDSNRTQILVIRI